VIKSLALFVNALYQSDHQFVQLNNDLATFTNSFTNTNHEVATALQDLNQLLTTTRQFIGKNGEVLTKDVNNLADVTNAIVQPDPLNGLEIGLHVFPTLGANLMNIVSPVTGGIATLPVINNFANPLQFVCSAIQAGSRLGYPGVRGNVRAVPGADPRCDQVQLPAIRPERGHYGKHVAEDGLLLRSPAPAPRGYKDTTVPGIWSRDTLFSYGNHEPGWVTAPGMQGVDVQPFTANMLTPESLSELMGGPDAPIPQAPPACGAPPGGNLPGPPDAYSENNPLPPPWYVQLGPPPVPAPGVAPGPPPGLGAPVSAPAGGNPAEGPGQ
jgi:phospholipid/cholesterol/gamma-HCH transport system substrate-binding protein